MECKIVEEQPRTWNRSVWDMRTSQAYKELLRIALLIAKDNRKTLLQMMPSWYKTICENYDAAVAPPVLERAYETVKETVETVVQVVETVWEAVTGFFSWLWNKFKQVVRTVVRTVSRVVQTVVEKVVEVTPQWVQDAYESAKEAFSRAGQAVSDFVASGVSMVRRGVSNAFNFARNAISRAAGRVQGALAKVWKWVVKKFNDLKQWLTTALESLADGLADLWSKHAPEWLKQALAKVRTWTSDAVSALGRGLKGVAGWLSAQLAKLLNSERLQFVWNCLKQFGKDCLTSIQKLFMKFIGLFTYRFRAQADIERFARWGSSEVTNFNFFLLDAVQNENGISRQQMRRRSALQAASQTGLMGWILDWDPSVRLNLETHQSEGVQQRQDRANREFLQEYQESSRDWSQGVAGLTFLFSSFMAVGALFTAELGRALLRLMQAMLAGAGLLTTHMQDQLQSDTTLTEQERQDMQDLFDKLCRQVIHLISTNVAHIRGVFSHRKFALLLVIYGTRPCPQDELALLQSVLGVLGLVLARFELQLVSLSAVGTAQLSEVVGMASRVLRMPSLLRTTDRALAIVGLNGARSVQLGMTSEARSVAVLLESFTIFTNVVNAASNEDFLQRHGSSGPEDGQGPHGPPGPQGGQGPHGLPLVPGVLPLLFPHISENSNGIENGNEKDEDINDQDESEQKGAKCSKGEAQCWAETIMLWIYQAGERESRCHFFVFYDEKCQKTSNPRAFNMCSILGFAGLFWAYPGGATVFWVWQHISVDRWKRRPQRWDGAGRPRDCAPQEARPGFARLHDLHAQFRVWREATAMDWEGRIEVQSCVEWWREEAVWWDQEPTGAWAEGKGPYAHAQPCLSKHCWTTD